MILFAYCWKYKRHLTLYLAVSIILPLRCSSRCKKAINGEPTVDSRTKVTLIIEVARKPRYDAKARSRIVKWIPLRAWCVGNPTVSFLMTSCDMHVCVYVYFHQKLMGIKIKISLSKTKNLITGACY